MNFKNIILLIVIIGLLVVSETGIRDITPQYGNAELKIVGVRGKGPFGCDLISEMHRRLSPGAKVYGQKTCDWDGLVQR